MLQTIDRKLLEYWAAPEADRFWVWLISLQPFMFVLFEIWYLCF